MPNCVYSPLLLGSHHSNPSNEICDLLLYNKLPYHVILTGRPNHACQNQSNYSTFLSKKPLSSPMSSFYTMQEPPSIWTSVSKVIKCHLNSLDVSNESIFIPPTVIVRLFLGMNQFLLLSQCAHLKKGQGLKQEFKLGKMERVTQFC